ncbi:DUF502 domain-containing protein [bacterium]|nr:DUF502 domain-containing protein [bacterium]
MKKSKINLFFRLLIKLKSFLFVLKFFIQWAFSKVWKSFVFGFIVILPLGGTIFIVWQLFEFVKGGFGWLYGAAMPWWAGLTLTLVIICFIGFLAKFTQSIYMSRLSGIFLKIVNRIPIIRNLYSTIQQLVEIIVSKPKMVFNEVALIEYPRRGIFCLVFVTETAPVGICKLTGFPEMKSVFLPTTPNPTSGFLLFLPVEDIHIVEMSVEGAMKLIISGGMLTPENIDNLKGGKTADGDKLLPAKIEEKE